ncbi:MAG: HNH endonuclease [Burkholderiales bacterium]
MTSKKSILKLSAREERELREAEAARHRRHRPSRSRAKQASSTRWELLVAWLDANLVITDDRANWATVNIGVSPLGRKVARMDIYARKNRAVFERDNFTCRDCLQEFDHPEPYWGETIPGLTRGHIIPHAQGGPNVVANLIAQCQPCNQALGNNIWTPATAKELADV